MLQIYFQAYSKTKNLSERIVFSSCHEECQRKVLAGLRCTKKWSFSLRISAVNVTKLRIWSHLLKKPVMENFIFCAVICSIRCWERDVSYEHFYLAILHMTESLKMINGLLRFTKMGVKLKVKRKRMYSECSGRFWVCSWNHYFISFEAFNCTDYSKTSS